MAIDHLKVNNVFELGKDEGTDYIILTRIGLHKNAMTLVVFIVRLKMSTQMRGRLKAPEIHYLCQFL